MGLHEGSWNWARIRTEEPASLTLRVNVEFVKLPPEFAECVKAFPPSTGRGVNVNCESMLSFIGTKQVRKHPVQIPIKAVQIKEKTKEKFPFFSVFKRYTKNPCQLHWILNL